VIEAGQAQAVIALDPEQIDAWIGTLEYYGECSAS
jgi:hypothetical protein